MNQPLIRLTEIAAAYDQKKVLEHINLEIAEKDFLGVIGPNGGGKTTLMKIILGLLKPSAGTIQFFHQGKEVNEITMGYLPQYNTIDKKFPISVYEVVLSGLNKQKSLFRSFSKAQHDKVRETIARMGLEGLEQRAIGQLSGGQLQRALLQGMRHRAGESRYRHHPAKRKKHCLCKRHAGLPSGYGSLRRMAGGTF